jgi:oxygen-independent coproporphyrinogen-3 oxidase
MMGDAYSQNQKDLKRYYAQVTALGHAQWKGCALTPDDLIRREVIKRLICDFSLDIAVIEQAYALDFTTYFATDLQLLQSFIDDGLVHLSPTALTVSTTGKLLIRNICMCFDRYMRTSVRQRQFSRVI